MIGCHGSLLVVQGWISGCRGNGGLYRVLHTALHSETEEKLVIYQSADGRIWARPYDMFHSPDPSGTGRRVAPIEGDEPVG